VYIAKAHQRYKYEGLTTHWVQVVSYNNLPTTWPLIMFQWETKNWVPELQVQYIAYRLTGMVQGMAMSASLIRSLTCSLNYMKAISIGLIINLHPYQKITGTDDVCYNAFVTQRSQLT
jgi:hypothetical protein